MGSRIALPVAHKPFWHDYGTSLTGYNMKHWSDGDDFVVNDVGHPMEGAVFGRMFLQNDPKSFVQIGRHNGYWKSRLWSATLDVCLVHSV